MDKEETISKAFAPSTIGRLATQFHERTSAAINTASQDLEKIFSERAAKRSDGNRKELLEFTKELQTLLDRKGNRIAGILDEALEAYKTARLKTKSGGAYEIDFAQRFSMKREEAEEACDGVVTFYTSAVDSVSKRAKDTTNVKQLKGLLNDIDAAADEAENRATRISRRTSVEAQNFLNEFVRYTEGFEPKSND